MNDFIDKVKLTANFTGSVVHSDDIAFFAPELSQWHRAFLFSGNAKGLISNFNVEQLDLKSNETSIRGNIGMRNIPDVDSMIIFFNSIESYTNYKELCSVIPSLQKPDYKLLNKLGTFSYVGKFSGTLNNFIAFGDLNTALGRLSADINIDLRQQQPLYTGTLNTNKFNIGSLTGNKSLGNIAMDGHLSGAGFQPKSMNALFNGSIRKFDFNGYPYENIKIDGSFSRNTFRGKLDINDNNLQLTGCEGSIAFENNILDCNMTGSLTKANLEQLGLIKQNISIAGDFDLNFRGSNIDDFNGDAKITNGKIQTTSKTLPIALIDLHAEQSGNQKVINLENELLSIRLEGNYKIKTLPDAFSAFLSNYFPKYVKKSRVSLDDQHLNFDIKTGKISPLLQLFDSSISGGEDAHISGSLELPDDKLTIDATIPFFKIDEKAFVNSTIISKGNRDSLISTATFEDIIIGDSLHFPKTSIVLQSSNDLTDIHINTSNESTINSAELNATLNTAMDGIDLSFKPSSFILNNKKWDISTGGLINLKKDNLTVDNLLIKHEKQVIAINSAPDEITNNINLTANLENINLADFVPYAFKDPKLKGTFSGKVTVAEPLSKLKVAYEGQADSLYIEDELIGKINISGDADVQTGVINYAAESADTNNTFTFSGAYQFKDSISNSLSGIFNGEKIKLSILRPYLSDVFDQVDGTAEGKLELSGNKDQQFFTGELILKNTVLKVLHTQCKYTINNQKIKLSKNKIEFPYLKIQDTLGNTATLFGSISHDFFSKFYFNNLRLETSRFALLHTTAKDNEAFYGNIIGRAKMNLSGPMNNLYMNVDGEPLTQDSSYVYINTSDRKESNTVDYIEFEKYGTAQDELKPTSNNNFILNVNVISNPACNVYVTLDETTNDVIKAQGNGNLSITIGNFEPLSIRGKYEIKKGDYTFKFQTFLDRPFTLNGGNINWNGNPYEAMIDINAQYTAKNVDLSSLSSRAGYQKQEVIINSKLTGVLQNPNVKFDIVLPEKSDARRDDIIVKRLADFKNDDNEMNKQVASLLLFNTFITNNQNFLSQGNASNLISNTIGGVMSNLLTSFFNKELEKATKGILSTYIDINPTLDLQKSTSQLQANIRAGLKILLNNRLNMQVGGNLDYNNPSYLQQLEKRGLLTPDINIEWLINKEGTLRVIGFNRSSIDFTFNQRNRSGLQLSYRKDVDHLGDLIKRKERTEKKSDKKE
jgi:hypothetical protein